MRVAVLPFNAAEGVKPALGRQLAAFAAEQLRPIEGSDINAVSLLAQIPDEQGVPRVAFVNLANDFIPWEQLKDLFAQGDVDLAMDGLLKKTETGYEAGVRFFTKDGGETPVEQLTESFEPAGVFAFLHLLVKKLAQHAELELPAELQNEVPMGTADPEAFLGFLEGYDALQYIGQAQGLVSLDFSPQEAIDSLLTAQRKDMDFLGPYSVLIQLARAMVQYRIGTFEMVEKALNDAIAILPDDYGAYFALGEAYGALGDHNRASDFYEKAIQKEPNDPALFTRLGLEQMQAGMPVNAERNLRKAMEMGGEDRSPIDLLSNVLMQTNRGHEVPALWKKLVDANDQDAEAWAKYATSLIQGNKTAEGEAAFEKALETVEDNVLIKRFYAPYIAQQGDVDRAMDFYEDCLDVAPTDVALLAEYCQVLEQAGREVDLQEALKQLIAANPDQNTRATAQARLIELEQPKRVENVEAAQQKMAAGDFDGAVQILKPLKNWLGDYWKMWAMLSSCYNNLGAYQDAEDAAMRLINLFPGCEPAYGELLNALGGQGRHEEGYNAMRMAQQQLPNSLGVVLNLGLAAKRAGHTDDARNLARQIREAIGVNEEVEPILAEMER